MMIDEYAKERVRDAVDMVELVGAKVELKREAPHRYRGLCPFHDERTPSFTIDPDQKVFHCFGCGAGGDLFEFVMQTEGLEFKDALEGLAEQYHISLEPVEPKVVATYNYVDEQGELLYQVQRKEPGRNGRRKDFTQRRPDGSGGWVYNLEGVRRVPYRLPEVMDAIAMGEPVILVEGEKDADTLCERGKVATTFPGGAGKWRPEYAEFFKGATMAVISDMDDTGRKHTLTVKEGLEPVIAKLVLLEPAEGKDVTDHLVKHKLAMNQLRPFGSREAEIAAAGEGAPPAEGTGCEVCGGVDGVRKVRITRRQGQVIEWVPRCQACAPQRRESSRSFRA
jgi:DNA primase